MGNEPLNQDRLEQEEALIHQEEQPTESYEYYNLEEYAGEIETVYWTPDKSNPTRKVMLALRTQALTGSQINLVNRKALRARNAAVEAEYLQQRINQHTMPREIQRLRVKLSEINDIDYDSPEKADEKRDALDSQITQLLTDWKTEHDQMNADLKVLLNHPTFYETLREEYFSVVIEDHSIAWKGKKLDFSRPMNEQEPPDKFVGELREFIEGVLQRKKRMKLNGSQSGSKRRV